MKTASFVIALLLSVASVANPSPDSLWTAGNSAYSEGRFDEAVIFYEDMSEEDRGVDWYYNAANAYFKSGELGMSILNYERCLRLHPNHEDANYNLDIARSRTVDRMEGNEQGGFSNWFSGLLQGFGADALAWQGILLALLSAFAFLAAFQRRGTGVGRLWILGGALLFLIMLVVSISAWQVSMDQEATKHVIILESKVEVMSAPSHDSTELFILHEGTRLDWVDDAGEWVEVMLPNGEKGYLPAEYLGKV